MARAGADQGQQEVVTTNLLQLLVHLLASAVPAAAIPAAVGVGAGGDQEVLSGTATSARLQGGERSDGGRRRRRRRRRQVPAGSLRPGVQGSERQEGHRHKARRRHGVGGGDRPAVAMAVQARHARCRGRRGDDGGSHGWFGQGVKARTTMPPSQAS